MLNCDDTLIKQAELKATGADIHDVINCVGTYRSCLKCITNARSLRLTKSELESATKMFANMVLILSKFVDGQGTIKEIRNKYPTPKWKA